MQDVLTFLAYSLSGDSVHLQTHKSAFNASFNLRGDYSLFLTRVTIYF